MTTTTIPTITLTPKINQDPTTETDTGISLGPILLTAATATVGVVAIVLIIGALVIANGSRSKKRRKDG